MPDAVIVDAVRTPIGRAAKGSLKDVRADDLAADPPRGARRAQPRRSTSPRPSTSSWAAASRWASRATTSAATRSCWPGSTITCPRSPSAASARPRCRRCGWPSTRSRPARATSTSPPASRRSRASPPSRRSTRTRSSTAPRARCATSTSPWASRRRTSPSAATCRARRRTSGRRSPSSARSRHSDVGSLRPRDRARHARRRDRGRQGRRPARRHDGRGARPAQAGVRPRDGTVTAGNACPLNDGAAAMLVMSAERGAASWG